jgi:hypothetical protein
MLLVAKLSNLIFIHGFLLPMHEPIHRRTHSYHILYLGLTSLLKGWPCWVLFQCLGTDRSYHLRRRRTNTQVLWSKEGPCYQCSQGGGGALSSCLEAVRHWVCCCGEAVKSSGALQDLRGLFRGAGNISRIIITTTMRQVNDNVT